MKFVITNNPNKDPKRICGNCKLFCREKEICGVNIIHEGEYLNIPVSPGDSCFFEQEYFDPITKTKEDFNEIKQLRMYEEKGKVKFEYPKEDE